MDQLKEQLAGVAKYGFWILCGVTIVGSLGIAFWSASGLASDRDSKIQELEGAKTTVQGIRNELSTHPNDQTRDAMDALLDQLQEDVAESWIAQYEQQTHLLVWPEEVLGKDFVDVFSAFEPIELTVEYPVPDSQEVEVGLRTRYRDYVGEVLPSIAEIAGAEWKVDFNADTGGMAGYGSGYGSAGGLLGSGDGESGGESSGGYGSGYGLDGSGGTTGAAQKDVPLVKWETNSQESLLANLFPWRGSDPNTLDVLYSQENLWILRQLMAIIDDVNGEAKQPFQATIRQINDIAIGRSAAMGGSLDAGGGYGMMGGGESMDSGGMSGGMSSGMSGGSMGGPAGPAGGGTRPDPADMRYVNVNYEPIEAATLRTSMQSASPENAYLTVAKRAPVRINVKMDQRKIPELVAACGNADLMVEVRQVRVNPKTAAPGLGGNGMASGGGGGKGLMGSSGSSGMSAGEGMGVGGLDGGMGGSGTPQAKAEFVNDVDVEVYGIVYIYNPPDMEKLGIEQVSEDTQLEGETENLAGESVAQPATGASPAADPNAPAAGQPADPATPADPTQPADPSQPADPTDSSGTGGAASAGAPPALDPPPAGSTDNSNNAPADGNPTPGQNGPAGATTGGDETQPPAPAAGVGN